MRTEIEAVPDGEKQEHRDVRQRPRAHPPQTLVHVPIQFSSVRFCSDQIRSLLYLSSERNDTFRFGARLTMRSIGLQLLCTRTLWHFKCEL